MPRREWTNVPGELLTDVPLVMPFLSSGYWDPGSMYGGPDRVGLPPEGEDERLPDGTAYLDFGQDGLVDFTKEQTEKLAELLRDELADADVEWEE